MLSTTPNLIAESLFVRGRMRLFTRIFLGYLLVILITGVGVVVIAGLVSPELYKRQLDRIALFLRPEFVGLRLTLEEGYGRTMIQALAIALPSSLLLGAGVAYLQTRRLLVGIRKLAAGSRSVARGRYEGRLEVVGDDELASLATDFNSMAEALQKAEQRRVELIGTVAHELRTPLAVQQGYAEALADDLVSSQEAARAMSAEVNTMRRLTYDLSLLTKLEAGALELQLAVHRPEDLIADVMDRFMYVSEEKALVLETELSKKLLPVRADRARVGQVLGNLLSNALRYTPGSGRVVLRVKPCEGCVEFSVADTGPGIAAEDQPYIFQRFYRAQSGSRNSSGTGIGLTIARGLVTAMGGRIWLESRAGQGSTFYFTLPTVNQP